MNQIVKYGRFPAQVAIAMGTVGGKADGIHHSQRLPLAFDQQYLPRILSVIRN